jgi:hypothetical protein
MTGRKAPFSKIFRHFCSFFAYLFAFLAKSGEKKILYGIFASKNQAQIGIFSASKIPYNIFFHLDLAFLVIVHAKSTTKLTIVLDVETKNSSEA